MPPTPPALPGADAGARRAPFHASRPVFLATALAALFFALFAGVYLLQLARGG